MKKLIFLGAFASFLLPLATFAQSNLDGTWKIDLSAAQIRDRKPLVILFQNGVIKDSSFPGMEIKADGQYYPLSKEALLIHPAVDMIAFKIVDARHLEVNEQKNGKLVGTAQIELSADGNTTTDTFSDFTPATPVTGKEISERVAPAPPGSEPFSGSWRLVKLEIDNSITFTFKTEGDSVHYTSSVGESYTAKLDGTEAPVHGNPGITSVSLKRTGPNTYESTDKLGDKVISVAHLTISADGKTLSVDAHEIRTDTTLKYVAIKQ